MLILFACFLAYQTDPVYYEGTLTVTNRSGPCEAQPESQRVMLVMKEESDRVEGYLAFTDKRLAKIEGEPGETLQVTFPAADPSQAEVWFWHLERVENGIAGNLEGKRLPDTQGCQTKQASISLGGREPFRTNFDRRARQFQALGLVARIDLLLANNETAKAIEVIEQALHMASNRQEVHLKAFQIAMIQDNPSVLFHRWHKLGLDLKNDGLDFRGAVALLLVGKSIQFVEEENIEKALEALEHACKLRSDNYQLLAFAAKLSVVLEKADQAVDYYQAAVDALLPRLAESPEFRREIGSYHAAISGVRSAMLSWEQSKLAQARGLVNLEIRENFEKWEKNNDEALFAKSEGLTSRAILIAKKNFRNSVNWFGASHSYTLLSMNLLAELHESQGNYETAQPLYEESLRLRKEVLGERHPDTMVSLNKLARLYEYQGAYEMAQPLYEETLRLCNGELGPLHPDSLSSLDNLARLYFRQGSYEAAQPLYEETLRLRTEVFGLRHSDTLMSLNNLAELFESQGNYELAQSLYDDALRLRKEVLGERHPDTLSSLSNLARLYSRLGAYETAQPLYEEALKLRKEVLGMHHPDTLMSLNNLAELYESQGVYEAAQPLYEEAGRLRKMVLGERHLDTLITLNNLAGLYERQGFHEAAQPLYEEALQIRKEMLGERHPDTLMSLHNFARLLHLSGANEVARPLCEEALRLRKEVLGERHPDSLRSMSLLAGLYKRQGDNKAAGDLFEKVFEMRKTVLGMTHPDTLESINNLAYFYTLQSIVYESQTLLENGIKQNRDVFEVQHSEPSKFFHQNANKTKEFLGDGLYLLNLSHGEKIAHPGVLTTNLSLLNAQLNKNRASQYFIEGANSSAKYLQRISGFDVRTRRIFLKTHHDFFRNAMFSFYSKNSEFFSIDSEIYYIAMVRKDMLFRMASDIHRTSMVQLNNFGVASLLQQLQRCRTELSSNALLATMSLADPGADRRQRLISELERLERDLGIQLKTTTFTNQFADEIFNVIPDNGILVDFHVFLEVNFETGEYIDEQLIAFIVDPQSEQKIRLVKLENSMTKIRKDLEVLRSAANSNHQLSLLKQAASHLFDDIWGPLEPFFRDKSAIYLVPDGVLHLVPWGAMMDKNGQFLAATTKIIILTSARYLNVDPAADPVQCGSRQPHLVFAPNYDLDLGEATHHTPNINPPFNPLAGAYEEGVRITELFRKHGREAVFSKGDQATETWVSQLKSPSLLHIATHGLFFGSNGPSLKGRSAIEPQFRDLEQAEARLYSELLPGERPMLASGLALAGANGIVKGRRAEDHTDGLLSALEVLSMDLRGTELVVLSACDTGLGEVNNGDGVYSLNRAFLEAGAKNVLSTLWKIDDHATVAFMESFYERYLQGKTPREALRLTQTQFMASENYSHPYYWAPFVLVGPD